MKVLTESQRDALPNRAFAFLRPKAHTEKRRRPYPVPTVTELEKVGVRSPKTKGEKLARSALQRSRQFGTPREQSLVCHKVTERYPEIHTSHCNVHRLRA